MGIIMSAIYNAFPGLEEFEKTLEESINEFKRAYTLGKNIGCYVLERREKLISKIEEGIKSYVSELFKEVKDDFTRFYQQSIVTNKHTSVPGKHRKTISTGIRPAQHQQASRAYQPTPIKAYPSPTPNTTPNPSTTQRIIHAPHTPRRVGEKKKTSLDDLIRDFKNKLAEFNKDFDAEINIYENNRIIRAYGLNKKVNALRNPGLSINEQKKSLEDKANETYTGSSLRGLNSRYVEDSIRIAELYNKGYTTRQIIREAHQRGYRGVSNYEDVTSRVVIGIKQGVPYTRRSYNNIIATKLGARTQLIKDYLAGKSYKEIKDNLRRNTNGMSISNSTILRIMHDYEKRTGRRVVGRRTKKRGKNGRRRKHVKKKNH